MLDSGNMKLKYLLTAVMFFILILVGGYIFTYKTQTHTVQNQNYTPVPVTGQAFSYECQAGKSAFDVLEEKAEVKFSESSFGKLVTSIDGKSQGEGKYWLYSVDEKEATIGATAYICSGKEEIKWELR